MRGGDAVATDRFSMHIIHTYLATFVTLRELSRVTQRICLCNTSASQVLLDLAPFG
jgi:hypothetical protein